MVVGEEKEREIRKERKDEVETDACEGQQDDGSSVELPQHLPTKTRHDYMLTLFYSCHVLSVLLLFNSQ